jgi:hypothetical protein
MSKRTLYLDDQTWDRLRALAFERRVTISEVVRERLTQPAPEPSPSPAPQPAPAVPKSAPRRAPKPRAEAWAPAPKTEPIPSKQAPKTRVATQADRDSWLRKMST